MGEPVGQLATRRDHAMLRQELKADGSGRHRDMERLELRMTVKLGTMIAGAVVLSAALTRLL